MIRRDIIRPLCIAALIACCFWLMLSLALGIFSFGISNAIADGQYDPIRDDGATPEQAAAVVQRLSTFTTASTMGAACSFIGLFAFYWLAFHVARLSRDRRTKSRLD
jgi:membrane associated rhomboid family serine protease